MDGIQTQMIGFRAPKILAEKLEERARAEGMRTSEYLRDLIRRDVREAA